jgi:hypothetical protein
MSNPLALLTVTFALDPSLSPQFPLTATDCCIVNVDASTASRPWPLI